MINRVATRLTRHYRSLITPNLHPFSRNNRNKGRAIFRQPTEESQSDEHPPKSSKNQKAAAQQDSHDSEKEMELPKATGLFARAQAAEKPFRKKKAEPQVQEAKPVKEASERQKSQDKPEDESEGYYTEQIVQEMMEKYEGIARFSKSRTHSHYAWEGTDNIGFGAQQFDFSIPANRDEIGGKQFEQWEKAFGQGNLKKLSSMYLAEVNKKPQSAQQKGKTKSDAITESETDQSQNRNIRRLNQFLFPGLIKADPHTFISWLESEPLLKEEPLYFELLFQEGLKSQDHNIVNYTLSNIGKHPFLIDIESLSILFSNFDYQSPRHELQQKLSNAIGIANNVLSVFTGPDELLETKQSEHSELTWSENQSDRPAQELQNAYRVLSKQEQQSTYLSSSEQEIRSDYQVSSYQSSSGAYSGSQLGSQQQGSSDYYTGSQQQGSSDYYTGSKQLGSSDYYTGSQESGSSDYYTGSQESSEHSQAQSGSQMTGSYDRDVYDDEQDYQDSQFSDWSYDEQELRKQQQERARIKRKQQRIQAANQINKVFGQYEQDLGSVGNWLTELADVVTRRNLCVAQFSKLWDTMLHIPVIDLTPFTSSPVFIKVLEKLHYNSNIDEESLHRLLTKTTKGVYQTHLLVHFKKSVELFRIRHGQLPFPAVKTLYTYKMIEQLRPDRLDIREPKEMGQRVNDKCKSKANPMLAMFYYILAVHNGEENVHLHLKANEIGLMSLTTETTTDQNALHQTVLDGWLNIPGKAIKDPNNYEHKVRKLYTYQDGKDTFAGRLDPDYESSVHDSQVQRYKQEQEQKERERIMLRQDKQLQEYEQERSRKIQSLQMQQAQYEPSRKRNPLFKGKDASKQQGQFQSSESFFSQEQQGAQNQNENATNQNDTDMTLSSDDYKNSRLFPGDFFDNITVDEQVKQKPLDLQGIGRQYSQAIKDEYWAEHNPLRKRLLTFLISSNQHSTARIKAAIKLNKPQLAYGLAARDILDGLIVDRTRKNVEFVVKRMLQEEHKRQYESTQHQMINGVKKMCLSLDKPFLKAVHQKEENFDELMKFYVPKGKDKFDFWEHSLMMERAQDILKLQASGQLDKMKYEPEYMKEPSYFKDAYISRHRVYWRNNLLRDLGVKPADHPTHPDDPHYFETSVNTPDELFHNYIEPKLYSEAKEILEQEELQYAQQQAAEYAEEGQYAQEGEYAEEAVQEGQQAVEAVEEAVVEEAEAEQVQTVGEAEIVQGQEQWQDADSEGANEPPVVEVKPIKTARESRKERMARQKQQKEKKVKKQSFKPDSKLYPSFRDRRVTGYDFSAFLKFSLDRVKPILENQYETDKENKKFFIALQALAEDARIMDHHYLMKKMMEAQMQIKSPEIIAAYDNFGLWNYNFQGDQTPEGYADAAQQFRARFFEYKKYNGYKIMSEEPKNLNLRQLDITNLIQDRYLNSDMVEEIQFKRRDLFEEAWAAVKLEPSEVAEDLIVWGVANDEPMGVYLGQKIAMMTSQTISHPVAQAVSMYLSHVRDIPQQRIDRCKECLKIVGRINRQHIYDFSRDYEHITTRKHFQKYLTRRQKELDSSALGMMTVVDPTHARVDGDIRLRQRIDRTGIVL